MGIRIFIVNIALVLMSLCVSGQGYRVVEKGGEKFYVHTVEKGNTLYAISKLYGVDEAYIEEVNNNIEGGLSIGQEIFIPIKFRDRKFHKKPKPEIKKDSIIHTVSKKETLYGIAKIYDIALNDLLDSNPGLTEDLERGQKVVIPLSLVKPKDASHTEIATEDTLVHHRVEKGQTLYAISKLYMVSMEDIIKVNNDLTKNLHTGALIRIPKLREWSRDNALDELIQEDIDFVPLEVKNVALLLPFEYKNADSLATKRNKRNAFALIDLAVEFYRGSKMACEEYSKDGGNVNLMVFTMKNEVGEVDRCIKEGWLDECDVVIGPFHKRSFTELSKRLKGKEKIMISPNLRSNSILHNERVFKVNPDKFKEVDFAAKHIAKNHFGENILVVQSTEPKDQALWKAMQNKLNFHLSEQEDRLFDQAKLITMEEEGLRGKRVLVMAKEIYSDTNNIIVVPSNDLSFVSDVLTKLNKVELAKKNIQVYGMESWIKFDNIDINYKQKFELKLSATKNLNYDDPGTRKFMRRYYRLYETIPSDQGYAFLSYDISHFVLKSLDEFGNKALMNLDKVEIDPIYQNISLVKTDSGSWQNNGFYFLNHKDFKLVKTE